MVFEKIIIKNYRQYKDITFEFNKDINIIEAKNGIGKSTFMSTIIFALYGIDQVRKSKLIEDMTYMANQDNVHITSGKSNYTFLDNNTEVILILKILESNKRYEVKRCLDNRRYVKEINYMGIESLNSANFEKIEAYEITNTGKISIELSEIIKIIPENIAPLLFFDGERINSIESVINTSSKSKEFQKEIETILKVGMFEEANSLIKKSEKEMKEKLVSNLDNEELNRLQIKCNELERKLDEIDNQKEGLVSKLESQKEETKKYEQLLRDNTKSVNLQKDRDAIKSRLDLLEKNKEVDSTNLLEMIWKDGPRLNTSSVFKSLNEVLGSEKSVYEISGMEQRAVDDILSKDVCICGMKITFDMSEQLRHLKETLPPESFESMFKSEVADSVNLEEFNKSNENLRIKFGKTISEINNLEAERKKISKQIQDIGAYEVINAEAKFNNSLELENKYKNDISRLEGEVKVLSESLNAHKKDLDSRVNRQNNSNIDRKVSEVLEQTHKYLKNKIKDKKQKIGKDLEKKVNDNVQLLMRDNAHITLKANLIPEVKFKAGSTSKSSGQNVMVSLSYLLGLMQIAKIQTEDEIIVEKTTYPLVMDGITATLDNGHIRSLVDNILDLNTQTIFLVNDSTIRQIELCIKEKMGLDSIEDKVIRLKRDIDTNTTYMIGGENE